MTVNQANLSGIWAAIHTPFDSDQRVNETGLRENIQHLSTALQLDGVFCSGIMGEFWALTLSERARIIDIVVAEAHPDMKVSAMTTHHSLHETIELSRCAESVGTDFIALMNPFVGPRSEDEVYRYFATICDELDSQVVLFNTPAFGYAMTAVLVVRLSSIPNVCAVKTTSSESEIEKVRALCGGRIVVSDPEEARWLKNMTKHGQQALFADPEPYLYQRVGFQPIAEYTAAFRAGDTVRAQEVAATIESIRRIYAKWIMEPLKSGVMPNAALKCWAEAMGMAAGPVRSPLTPLPSTDKRELLDELAGVGLV
jgi:4-hydroxy-tetrahydrodipicolinate synthase